MASELSFWSKKFKLEQSGSLEPPLSQDQSEPQKQPEIMQEPSILPDLLPVFLIDTPPAPRVSINNTPPQRSEFSKSLGALPYPPSGVFDQKFKEFSRTQKKIVVIESSPSDSGYHSLADVMQTTPETEMIHELSQATLGDTSQIGFFMCNSITLIFCFIWMIILYFFDWKIAVLCLPGQISNLFGFYFSHNFDKPILSNLLIAGYSLTSVSVAFCTGGLSSPFLTPLSLFPFLFVHHLSNRLNVVVWTLIGAVNVAVLLYFHLYRPEIFPESPISPQIQKIFLVLMAVCITVCWLFLQEGRAIVLKKAIVIARRAKELVEKTSLFKANFLSNMSHELRTPLTSIVGFAELIKAGEVDANSKEVLNLITACSENLLNIFSGITNMSSLSPTHFELFQFVQELLETYSFLLTQSPHFVVMMQFPMNRSHLFAFDQNFRLQQCIHNLLSVSLSLSNYATLCLEIHLGVIQDRFQQIIFEVSIGGTLEAEKMLKAFCSAPSSIRKGRGLSTTLELIEAMKGSILNSSDSGFTFDFWLRLDCVEKTLTNVEEPFPECAPIRLLLIGDQDPLQRQRYQMFLSECFSTPKIVFRQLEQELDIIEPVDLVVVYSLFVQKEFGKILSFCRHQTLPNLVVFSSIHTLVEKFVHDSLPSVRVLMISKPVCFGLSLKHRLLDFLTLHDPLVPVAQLPTPIKNSITVLVVEDNLFNQRLLHYFLEKLGFQVEVAIHGLDALEKLSLSHNYFAIITDIWMPIMDGLSLAAKIRASENPFLARIPIIAITADTNTTHNPSLFNQLLFKPIKLSQLKDVLETLRP